mmetsp:Transcript_17767/g.26914  ORF Transcript_17767/g.26914 Transcript_17767/m.26914 type:complete len:109 (-) Transcript_17767:4157-4483(-)
MNISRRLSPSRHNLNHWSLWRYNYPFAASVLVVTLIISHIPCQDAFMFRVVNNPLPSCTSVPAISCHNGSSSGSSGNCNCYHIHPSGTVGASENARFGRYRWTNSPTT